MCAKAHQRRVPHARGARTVAVAPGPDGVVVQNAVRELPGDQRRAIELAFFDGLTHQEIAAALNEPLGTIKARVRRGMLKLRAGLEQLL